MLNLILAIVCSAMISVLMRIGEKHSKSGLAMLAMNYLMCAVLGWAFTGVGQLFPAVEGLRATLGLGVIGGVLFLGAFMLLQWNISKNGVVLPATFMKLGVLVPTVMAIAVFGESPKITQLLGIAAAICAIFMIQGRGDGHTGSVAGLVFLLLVGGLADAMSKIYEVFGQAQLQDHYLLYVFGVALILCIVLCIVRRQKPGLADVAFGLLLGVPNYLSSRFLLLSLSEIPAVVAYPSFSVGTIVLVAVSGAVLFKEKLSKRKLAALGVILAALVLLNV